MRRIFVFNRVSADGYFASADGKVDWFVPDEEIDSEGAKGTAETDTVLFGRRTYEMMAAFWPHASSDPHSGRPLTASTAAMARFLNESTKIVFSKSLKEASWKNTRIVREIDPKQIAALKDQPGKNIIIIGSGSIVAQLTKHRLIDEYHLVVTPVFLGSGKPLTSEGERLILELTDSKAYKSGNVVLRYRTPSW
jgi:dihydrofolate reductase